MDKLQKIQIKSCHNGLLWYNKHIGEQYEVKRWETTETGKKHAWVYEIYQGHRFLNWVDSRDYVLVE